MRGYTHMRLSCSVRAPEDLNESRQGVEIHKKRPLKFERPFCYRDTLLVYLTNRLTALKKPVECFCIGLMSHGDRHVDRTNAEVIDCKQPIQLGCTHDPSWKRGFMGRRDRLRCRQATKSGIPSVLFTDGARFSRRLLLAPRFATPT
jgi:hypothetical protein